MILRLYLLSIGYRELQSCPNFVNMPIVKISGDISHEEITELIKKTYPGRKIKVSSTPPPSARSNNCGNFSSKDCTSESECNNDKVRRERLLTTTPREGFDDTPRSSSDKLSSSRTTFSKSSSGISTIDSNFDDMKSPSALQCEIERLQKVLNAKNIEINEQSESLKKAFTAIQQANKQQQNLFDDFVVLRTRYDEQKKNLINILWEHTSKFHPALSYIPKCENTNTFIETDQRVGNYLIFETLGEGEFATVKSCQRREIVNVDNDIKSNNNTNYEPSSQSQLAIKIIQKEKILNFIGLTRVNTEIEILQKLRSKFTIQFYDIFQTATNLYLVTEKGGIDMFDFFELHPGGIQEKWAKSIVYSLLRAVKIVHDHGYCHRDLKPENILLTFDNDNPQHLVSLKLCDFGLCTRSISNLSDFCGSPGFFAPEIIINDTYQGDKADIWSIGCVILELVLGHEKFCEHWMVAYDYENLQDSELFTKAINLCVSDLKEIVFQKEDCGHFSEQLKSFLSRLLIINPYERPSLRDLLNDPWLSSEFSLDDIIDEDIDTVIHSTSETTIHSSSVPTPRGFVSPPPPTKPPPPHHIQNKVSVKGTCSDRERKMMDDFNHGKALKIGLPSDDHGSFSLCQLPPLDPATPSIKSALKKMFKPSPSASPSASSSPSRKKNYDTNSDKDESEGSSSGSSKSSHDGIEDNM